jgi:hypothetical protein
MFRPISEVHKINIRHKQIIHRPTASLALRQKDVLYAIIKLYKKLTLQIKILPTIRRQSQLTLKGFILAHTSVLLTNL